jgi:hypothetical protein
MPVSQVNYVVHVVDFATNNFLDDALVSVSYEDPVAGTDNTTTKYTASGSATFILPNNTWLSITAMKTGYTGGTTTVNSGPTSYNTTSVIIHRPLTTASTSPTRTGAIPTRTVVTGNVTPIPTTTPLQYNGFWAPLANGLSQAGAMPTEIGVLLAAILVFVGYCIGGWSGAPYGGAGFNHQGSIGGAVVGFVLSCAFSFIPLVWVIVILFIGIFYVVMTRL